MSGANCSELPPSAEEVFTGLHGLELGFMISGLVCSAIVLAVFIEEVVTIRRYLWEWSSKKKVVLVLGIYPVIGLTSLVGVMVPRAGLIVDLVFSVYVSSCLLIFLRLVVHYYGGHDNMSDVMDGQPMGLNQPPCCCCPCLPKIIFNRKNIERIELLVGQYALLKPFISFTIAVLWSDGIYVKGQFDPREPYLYMTVLNIASMGVAMYGLRLTFAASRMHLKPFSIIVKFLCIIAAMLMTNIQATIFNILVLANVIKCEPPFDHAARGDVLNHYLLMVEMVLLSVVSRCSFRFARESQFTVTRQRKFVDISFQSKGDLVVANNNAISMNNKA